MPTPSPDELFQRQLAQQLGSCRGCGEDLVGPSLRSSTVPAFPASPIRSAEQFLHSLDSLTRERCASFFRQLLETDAIGHTLLFDTKPVSDADICRIPGDEALSAEARRRVAECQTMLEVLPRIPTDIVSCRLLTPTASDRRWRLLLLRPTAVRRVVEQNHYVFQAIFGEAVRSGDVLQAIAAESSLPRACASADRFASLTAIGILYGFGQQAAGEFAHRSIAQTLSPQATSDDESARRVHGAGFRVLSYSREAELLNLQYERERRAIEQLLDQPDWLARVLRPLWGGLGPFQSHL